MDPPRWYQAACADSGRHQARTLGDRERATTEGDRVDGSPDLRGVVALEARELPDRPVVARRKEHVVEPDSLDHSDRLRAHWQVGRVVERRAEQAGLRIQV